MCAAAATRDDTLARLTRKQCALAGIATPGP
jgi:hypothetical protein